MLIYLYKEMKNKEIKSYANKIINLEKQLAKSENSAEKKSIELKIEGIVEEILSSEDGYENFLKIDEIINQKI